MADEAVNRGVKTRLFGVVLIFLGALDSMLSWRGGVSASGAYGLMIAAGLFLYALGAARRGRHAPPARADEDAERRSV